MRKSLPVARLPPDQSQVHGLKRQMWKCCDEKRLLKAKTAKMRTDIDKKDSKIQRIFTQTREQQELQTATPSTIRELKKSVRSLQREKAAKLKELENAENSSALWTAKELEIDILTLYQDQIRLQEILKDLQREAKEATANLEEAKRIMDGASFLRAEMCEVRDEMPIIQNKVDSYTYGRSKTKNTNALLQVQENPQSLDEVQSAIKKEIEELTELINQETVTARRTEEMSRVVVSELNEHLDDAVMRLSQILSC